MNSFRIFGRYQPHLLRVQQRGERFQKRDDLCKLVLAQIQRFQFAVIRERFGRCVVMVQHLFKCDKLTRVHEWTGPKYTAQGGRLEPAFVFVSIRNQVSQLGTIIGSCIAVNVQTVEFIWMVFLVLHVNLQ